MGRVAGLSGPPGLCHRLCGSRHGGGVRAGSGPEPLLVTKGQQEGPVIRSEAACHRHLQRERNGDETQTTCLDPRQHEETLSHRGATELGPEEPQSPTGMRWPPSRQGDPISESPSPPPHTLARQPLSMASGTFQGSWAKFPKSPWQRMLAAAGPGPEAPEGRHTRATGGGQVSRGRPQVTHSVTPTIQAAGASLAHKDVTRGRMRQGRPRGTWVKGRGGQDEGQWRCPQRGATTATLERPAQETEAREDRGISRNQGARWTLLHSEPWGHPAPLSPSLLCCPRSRSYNWFPEPSPVGFVAPAAYKPPLPSTPHPRQRAQERAGSHITSGQGEAGKGTDTQLPANHPDKPRPALELAKPVGTLVTCSSVV